MGAFSYDSATTETFRAALLAVTRANPATVSRLVEAYPDGRGLGAATIPQLRACGCTLAQATRILAAYHLVRTCDTRAEDRAKAHDPQRTPDHIARLLRARGIADLEQETFHAIALDARQRVIEICEVARGSIAHVDVHPREIFVPAMRAKAHGIVVAHNHPSGDPEPSDADLELTRRIREVGRIVGIPVFDHIIITPREHVSLAALGFVG